MSSYNPHCCICGRYCRFDSDYSIPFTSGEAVYPPSEEYYCVRCAEKEKQYHIQAGWIPPNWHKAKWEFEVAEVLGFVLIKLVGAAWSLWHKASEPIPDGYVLCV